MFLISVKPAGGVKADIIGLNGEVLVSSKTDSKGHAVLSNINDFTKEKAPVAYILTTKDDFSLMPYSRIDRQVIIILGLM